MLRQTLLTPRPSSGSAWVALAAIWIIALFSAEYWHGIVGVQDLLSGNAEQVFGDGEWWRLGTTMLVHADIKHLVGNAMVLALFTYLIYGYFGPAVFPLGAFGVGVVCTAITLWIYPPEVTVVGISGLVYALATFWLTSFFLIQRNHSVGKRLLRCLGFSLVMLIPSSVEPNVSYIAHGVGAALGLVAGIAHFYLRMDWIRSHEVYEEEGYDTGLTFTPEKQEEGPTVH